MIYSITRDLFTPTTVTGRLAVIYDAGLAYAGRGWAPSTDLSPRAFGTTLEDTDRGLAQSMTPAETKAIKVRHLTAIGVGRYRVRVAMSPKRRRLVMWLDEVVGYQAVQMHSGAVATHTDGCPLVGMTREPGRIRGGPVAEAWLLARVQECEARGEEVWCEIGREAGAWAAFRKAASLAGVGGR